MYSASLSSYTYTHICSYTFWHFYHHIHTFFGGKHRISNKITIPGSIVKIVNVRPQTEPTATTTGALVVALALLIIRCYQ